VVDDDLETPGAVATMLSGRSRSQVADRQRCHDRVEDFRPEVLVCDIAMRGRALIRRVRDLGADRGGGAIPALALTAFAGEENRRRALSAGFQMYLAKPVDMDHLLQAVADLSHRPTAASADVEQTIASDADPERR
jgi:CheY-like chemotaxis protein